MLCQECPQKNLCSSLCPEAELYAKQVEVPQKEKTIGLVRYGKFPDPMKKLSKREKQIVTLLANGRTRKEICQLLEISTQNLRMIISRANHKLL